MPNRNAPETKEGLFVSHLIFSIDPESDSSGLKKASTKIIDQREKKPIRKDLIRLVSSQGDLMLINFAETMEELEETQRDFINQSGNAIERVYSFLSVSELSFYSTPEEQAKRRLKGQGISPHDDNYDEKKNEMLESIKGYEKRRLEPELPDMRYVTFYPMNKRRSSEQNWYQLPAKERAKLMKAHGVTGRKYAGKIQQFITSCVGLDEWEWGVTLYAHDAKDFKRLIYEMRFDEVSAVYSDFGPFYTGFRIDRDNLGEFI